MAKKQPALKPPSQQSIETVLQAADSAPRRNGPESRQVDAAVNEVAAFFRELLQIKSQGVMPQATAIDDGKPVDQG